MRFLIADDEKDIVESMTDFFIKGNWGEIDVAYSVTEAKEKLINNKYDVLLTDYCFPDGTGGDLVRYCRSEKALNSLYIIIISGKTGSEYVIRYQRISFLSKPFGPKSLEDTINNVLQLKVNEQQANIFDPKFIQNIADTTKEIVKYFTDEIEEISSPTSLPSRSCLSGELTTMMCIDTNKFRCSMCMTFDRDSILEIVSKMIFEQCLHIDDLVVDASGELINIVVGNLKAKLPEYAFALSAPSVVFGPNYRIQHLDGSSCVEMKFKTASGAFKVNLRLLPPHPFS